MDKEIIVIGDIEIGAGTLTDDFISDNTFVEFINELRSRKHPVDLVLNGDTFDFLKCPYFKKGKATYPRHISLDISLQKLQSMYKAHTPFFTALAEFVKDKKNALYFIYGNHDMDLEFPEVKKEIRTLLKNRSNVHFKMYYQQHKVYAEHGHEYDFLNKVQRSELFLTHDKKAILNFPWISFGIMGNMMFVKEKHPFLERIKPYPMMFNHHKMILHKLMWEAIKYLFMSIFYYPIRYFTDPTYSLPKGLIGEFYHRLKNAHWDVDNVTEVFKRRRRRRLHRNKIFVFGHLHEKFVEEKNGKVIIHPDTWRDEYTMDPHSKKLYHKKKMYVQVLVEGNNVEWHLRHKKVDRSTLHFNDVVNDEVMAVRKAAAEEDYPLAL